MRKFGRFLKKVGTNFWVQLVFLIGCIAAIFALGGVFSSPDAIGQEILEIITSVDIISILLAAVFSLIVARIVLRIRHITEETKKIEQDHHKIVCKYNGHAKADIDRTQNFCDREGVFMYLDRLPAKRKTGKNPEDDSTTDTYKQREKDIASYKNGRLYLPVTSVYTNALGNTKICFRDSVERYKLPTFVQENTLKLMEAHFVSKTTNSDTVRLNDFSFGDGCLYLDTMRTQYFDMLMTNRCMDYALDDVVTMREVYEYNSKVTPLKESQLGNQIGINGLIVSNDGYILMEKRGRKKAVWKDKFAQPISLAMKKNDLVDPDGKIGGACADAEATFQNIILKTVKKNFGLTEKELLPFRIETNFFGIARDLLEGGKPNLYFYVTANMSADELKAFLEDRAKGASRGEAGVKFPSLTKDKLESDFYLIHNEDIEIDYDYALKIKARKIKRIKRRYAPTVSRLRAAFDGFGYRLKKAFNLSLKKGCGEALLSCFYYADACSERLTAEQKHGRTDHE